MTNAEIEMVRREVRDAMRKAGAAVRDGSLQIVRQFGGRVSNEELAGLIERMPIPGGEEQG